jgi:hypothetical protein
MNSSLAKNNTFKNDVIFIDGFWGTGKSIIAPIVGAMEGVEKQKIEHIYEYLCVLIYLNKIEADAADSLLKIYADLSQYNNLIGREVNLRWHDDSGPRNNPNSLRYVQRIFGKEGDKIIEDINEQNLALNVMSHMITQISEPLVNAYGNRLKIIEMVRHPVYMVQHWYSYLSKFDSEREFTISFDHNNQKVPWFASSWKDKYVEMTVMDRALNSIIFLYDLLFKSLDNLNIQSSNILVISFESFVMNTEDELQRLQDFLGRSHSNKIKKILKQQKIPRKQLSQGKGHIGYGWKKIETNTEHEYYKSQIDFIYKESSKDVLDSFKLLIKKYNDRWPCVSSSFD